MAKKAKTNKLKMRGYRTQKFLRYKVTHTGTEDNHYIDIARDLSAINRRMYRQGMIYNISNIAVHDAQSAMQFEFCTLRDAWPTYSAYRQARRIWKRQHYGSGKNVGAWTQFVVGMDRDQLTDVDTLLPLSQEEWTVSRGEWLCSMLTYSLDLSSQDEDGAALVMLGASDNSQPTQGGDINSAVDSSDSQGGYEAHGCAFIKNQGSGNAQSFVKQTFTGSLGIMEEYGHLKADVQETPDETHQNSGVFAKLDQMASGFSGHVNDNTKVLERVDQHYDHPPYTQDIVGLQATGSNADTYVARELRFASGQKTLMAPGFDVPLGLIQVVTSASGDGTGYIDIELSPGRYKGVAALEI